MNNNFCKQIVKLYNPSLEDTIIPRYLAGYIDNPHLGRICIKNYDENYFLSKNEIEKEFNKCIINLAKIRGWK